LMAFLLDLFLDVIVFTLIIVCMIPKLHDKNFFDA